MVQQVILAADVEVMSEQGDKHREASSSDSIVKPSIYLDDLDPSVAIEESHQCPKQVSPAYPITRTAHMSPARSYLPIVPNRIRPPLYPQLTSQCSLPSMHDYASPAGLPQSYTLAETKVTQSLANSTSRTEHCWYTPSHASGRRPKARLRSSLPVRTQHLSQSVTVENASPTSAVQLSTTTSPTTPPSKTDELSPVLSGSKRLSSMYSPEFPVLLKAEHKVLKRISAKPKLIDIPPKRAQQHGIFPATNELGTPQSKAESDKHVVLEPKVGPPVVEPVKVNGIVLGTGEPLLATILQPAKKQPYASTAVLKRLSSLLPHMRKPRSSLTPPSQVTLVDTTPSTESYSTGNQEPPSQLATELISSARARSQHESNVARKTELLCTARILSQCLTSVQEARIATEQAEEAAREARMHYRICVTGLEAMNKIAALIVGLEGRNINHNP